MTGNEILARALADHGADVIFFLMGGPMIDCENACNQREIRMIDVRHEQAAAMMANAYSRLRRRPAVCMGCHARREQSASGNRKTVRGRNRRR